MGDDEDGKADLDVVEKDQARRCPDGIAGENGGFDRLHKPNVAVPDMRG
jgi:hypothetical protein